MTSQLRPGAWGGANPTASRAWPQHPGGHAPGASGDRPSVPGQRARASGVTPNVLAAEARPFRAQSNASRARARPPGLRATGGTAQRGAVTVELVGIIPLLVAVTLAMVGLIAVARDEVLAQSAAREGAREAALGADDARTALAARAALPPGRVVRVAVIPAGPDRVRVTVALETRLLVGVPPVDVQAEAVALREPGPSPPAVGP
jgi:TadE-like protein